MAFAIGVYKKKKAGKKIVQMHVSEVVVPVLNGLAYIFKKNVQSAFLQEAM